MKRLVLLVLLVCVCATARADWADVREGIDAQAVMAAVGVPLLVNASKTKRQVTWTYDDGAYILFENGRVRFWQAPTSRKKGNCPATR